MNLAGILALAGVTLATVTDWKKRKVPNWLTVPLVLLGIVLGTGNSGMPGFFDTLMGAGLGLGLLMFPFAMGWMGGGDVKLLMAVGALVGVHSVLWVALYGAVAGGAGALVLIVYRMVRAGEFLAQLRLSLIALGLWLVQLPVHRLHKGPAVTLPATRAALREKFPYAFAIAAGTLLVLWQGHP